MARTAAGTSRRLPTVLLAAVGLAALLLGGSAPPAQAASCGGPWGSLTKRVDTASAASLVGVRTGQSACFDRLVLDLGTGPAPGYWVSYVPQVTQDGSGDPIPTRGSAALQVVVHASAYDNADHATYTPSNPSELAAVGGYRTLRQVVWGSSFEGDSTVGVGVRARLPFRTFVLPSPGGGSRLVVDVAHTW